MIKLKKSIKPSSPHSHQQTEFLVTVLTRLCWSFFISFWWDCVRHSWFHVHVLIGNITVEAADETKPHLVKKTSEATQTKSQMFHRTCFLLLLRPASTRIFHQLKWQLKCRRPTVKNVEFRDSQVPKGIGMYFEESAEAWDCHLLHFLKLNFLIAIFNPNVQIFIL